MNKWTTEEEHLLRLLRSDHGLTDISIQFCERASKQIPGFSFRTPDAIRKKCLRDDITPETCIEYTEENNPYRERLERIKEIQKLYKSESIVRSKGILDPSSIVTKILTLSDLHMPFSRDDIIMDIIEEHKDANVVLINGDLMEGYVYSTYEKAKRIAALHEYEAAIKFVGILSEIFPHVVLVSGNHDARPARSLKKAGFDKEASQLLRPDLLARIANGEMLDDSGLTLKKLGFDNVHYQARESWYCRIGKTIFCHPFSRIGSQPGFAAMKADNYFNHRYTTGEYDSIVVGHTHRIFKTITNSRLLIEQGSLTDLLGYSHGADMTYLNNAMNGYAVVYQDKDGNTDFNFSGPIFVGEALPPKKSIIDL